MTIGTIFIELNEIKNIIDKVEADYQLDIVTVEEVKQIIKTLSRYLDILERDVENIQPKKGSDSYLAKVSLTAHDFEEIRNQENPQASVNMFLDSMLRRFKKQVENEDILYECKKREFFLKKSIRRREKSKRAKIRELKYKKKSSRN